LFTQRPGLRERIYIGGNAGTDDDQVLSAKGPVAVAAGFDGDAVVKQYRDFLRQLVSRLGIGNGDNRAARFQKERVCF
jgi:hypothetical protein